jgi:peptide/nickel transport system substrate-binding protein
MPATWLQRVALCILGFVAGCRGDSETRLPIGDQAEPGGTLVIASTTDLNEVNPLVSGERWAQEVNRYVLFLPLLRYDADLGYEPWLAASFTEHGDTLLVVELRSDVRWHDGVATTADDVAFSFERAKEPETGFPNAAYFAKWTGVEVIDSLTVHFRYEPHADPLAGLPFFPIVPRHLLDTVPAARMRQAAFNRRPVGNGPFRFVEYRANDRWIFEANPDFSEELGGRPYLDRIIWRVVPEASAQVTELQTGNVDLALNAMASQVMALDAEPGIRAVVQPSRNYAFIGWNGRRPPLNDARVRRALTMALNRQEAINALRAGYGELAVGPVGPFHWSYDHELEPLRYDAEAARALLRQAGIEDRNGDGTLQLPDGRAFAIELKMPAQSAFNRDMAELVRRDLSAIGVRLTTRPTEMGTLVGDISPPGRNFDAVLLAWSSDFRVDLRDLFHSDADGRLFGLAGYSNPEVDALIERIAVAHDRAEATPLLQRLQLILRDEQPWSFLYYYPDLFALRERVQGVETDIRGAFVNVQHWWIPRSQQGRVRDAVPPGDSVAHDPSPAPAPAP